VQVAAQSKTAGSNVTYFNGPVVLHIKGSIAAQDTTIVFFDWGGGNLSYAGNGLSAPVPGNLLSYNLSFTPVTVNYDDSARTLSTGSTIQLTTLGVKVTGFTAHRSGNSNEINLSTVADQPIQKVLLLRSIDGTNFKEIGQMTAKVNANYPTHYYYADANTTSGTCFYKAEIISLENKEFTNVVKIQSYSTIVVAITPNPADKLITISFDNNERAKTTVHIINTDGKLLMNKSTNDNHLYFNSGNLANGVYAIQLIQDNEMLQTKKLIIRH
jgi:hypothetical protein